MGIITFFVETIEETWENLKKNDFLILLWEIFESTSMSQNRFSDLAKLNMKRD